MLLNQSLSLSCLHSWACPIAKNWLLWFSVSVQRQRLVSPSCLKVKWKCIRILFIFYCMRLPEERTLWHSPLTVDCRYSRGLCMGEWMNDDIALYTFVCVSAQAEIQGLSLSRSDGQLQSLATSWQRWVMQLFLMFCLLPNNPKLCRVDGAICVLNSMVMLAWSHNMLPYCAEKWCRSGNWQLLKLIFCLIYCLLFHIFKSILCQRV